MKHCQKNQFLKKDRYFAFIPKDYDFDSFIVNFTDEKIHVKENKFLSMGYDL